MKKLLHAKGLPDNVEHLDAFLEAVKKHPEIDKISHLADIIASPLSFYAKKDSPDQSI